MAITLLLATRNQHKVQEIRAVLGNEFTYLTLKEFPEAPEVMEDATTFAGNATKKSITLADWFSSQTKDQLASGSSFILADDSGLEVDALKGAPGVHSARYAALDIGAPGNSSDEQNRAKLLKQLEKILAGQRTARFRCVLALTPLIPQRPSSASPVCYANEFEMQTELFEGVCEGKIVFTPRGQGGFGYDPLFVPNGYEQTFSELGEELKNRLSHRGQALAKLLQRLAGHS